MIRDSCSSDWADDSTATQRPTPFRPIPWQQAMARGGRAEPDRTERAPLGLGWMGSGDASGGVRCSGGGRGVAVSHRVAAQTERRRFRQTPVSGPSRMLTFTDTWGVNVDTLCASSSCRSLRERPLPPSTAKVERGRCVLGQLFAMRLTRSAMIRVMAVLDEYLSSDMFEMRLFGELLHQQTSCLRAVLRDARGATSRDLDTGELLPDGDRSSGQLAADRGHWLGAVGYMLMLDQLGTAVKLTDVREGNAIARAMPPAKRNQKKARRTPKANAFKLTLYRFSDVTDDEGHALWALRNAFAHDYSLMNKPTHRFMLTDVLGRVVEPATNKWNGKVGDTDDTDTTVGLVDFGDLCEQIHRQVLDEHKKGNLAMAIPESEMKERCFFNIIA